MYTYKLNWGTHRVAKGKESQLFKKDDLIQTTVKLDELFPLKLNAQWKFELVDSPVSLRPDVPVSVVRSPSNKTEDASEQASSVPSINHIGDVTSEFKPAKGLKVTVTFDGTSYVVTKEDGEILNTKKKLTTPKSVKLFLKLLKDKG